MKNARPLILQKFFEIAIDALLTPLAFAAAYLFRIGSFTSSDFPFPAFFQLSLLITPLFLFVLAWSGRYSLRTKNNSDILRIASFSALSAVMLFVLIFFFKREFFFSRLMVFYIWFFLTLFSAGAHFFWKWRQQHAYRTGKNILRTLIIGNGRAAEKIIRVFRVRGDRCHIVAMISPHGGGKKEIDGVRVLGKMNALEEVIQSEKIEAIIHTEAIEHTLNIVQFCEGKFLDLLITPQLLGIFGDRFLGERRAGLPFIQLQISPLFGWGQVSKRAFDLFISGILLFFLSPFFVFKEYQKVKCSSNMGTFEKYEFLGSTGKMRFLAEVMNVFRGEMSFVGPRPRPASLHTSLHAQRRLAVRPGIFSPASLARQKGEHPSISDEIATDIHYILRWHFGRDMILFAQSLFFLFNPV